MPQKQKLETEKKVKIVKRYSRKGKHARSGSRGRCGSENTSKVGHAVRIRRGGSIPAEQAKPCVQSGIKAAGGTGVFVRKRKSGRAQQKYGLRGRRQLQNWLKVYHAHGDFNSVKFSGGGSYMKQWRDTTQEERIQIV